MSINNIILNKLGVTQEEFDMWDTNEYPMDQAVVDHFDSLLQDAAKVRIFGDYDCDGETSTAIMYRMLTDRYPIRPKITLPRRFTDGFGIKSYMVDRVYEKDKELLQEGKRVVIITVDNGIAGYDAVARAKEYGYTVIVTDHHELGNAMIPPADLVIDPTVPSCNPFSFRGYCGAGIAYKIAEAIYKKHPCLYSDMLLQHLRVLAAWGTVADVAPLIEDNHKIVKRALAEIRKGMIPEPLRILAIEAGMDYRYITEKDFGFLFGPIANAAGRLNDDGAFQVVDFLLTPSASKAKELISLNEHRKELVKQQLEMVERYISDQHLEYRSPLWIELDGLNEGIVGILAGKISEKYHVPCLILTDHSKDLCKGSARAPEGFQLFDYLSQLAADHPEYFAGFGGHAGAAGLTIHREYLPQIRELCGPAVSAETITVSYDAIIEPEEIPQIYQSIQAYAPFGEGNPDPIFRVTTNRAQDRCRMIGKDQDTFSCTGEGYKLIHFRHTQVDPAINKDAPFDLVGPLSLNVFNGYTSVQILADAVLPEHQKELVLDATTEKDFALE